MANEQYKGLLLVGDPHVEGRVPGFRKDDYPRVVLEKLAWCLRYAREQGLLPVILGDLFHLPRDNPNWLLGELISLLDPPVLGTYGNHDCHQDQLTDDDSFSVLLKAGRILVPSTAPYWSSCMNGRTVVIGCTPWGKHLPKSFDGNAGATGIDKPLVFWLAHHDVKVPGYEEQGHFSPYEIPGVDVVINGHIHRRLSDVQVGTTVWITPGNISRRARSDASRAHIPAAMQIDISRGSWTRQMVEIPHRPFDEVFYHEVIPNADVADDSTFVTGLAELQSRQTATGAGLLAFIEQNVTQFDADIAAEILELAKEVTSDAEAN